MKQISEVWGPAFCSPFLGYGRCWLTGINGTYNDPFFYSPVVRAVRCLATSTLLTFLCALSLCVSGQVAHSPPQESWPVLVE